MLFDATEKMQSALKDMAIMAMHYYKELKHQGFTDEQAFLLVVEWQKAIMGVGVINR
jgi:hypothetical protein